MDLPNPHRLPARLASKPRRPPDRPVTITQPGRGHPGEPAAPVARRHQHQLHAAQPRPLAGTDRFAKHQQPGADAAASRSANRVAAQTFAHQRADAAVGGCSASTGWHWRDHRRRAAHPL